MYLFLEELILNHLPAQKTYIISDPKSDDTVFMHPPISPLIKIAERSL